MDVQATSWRLATAEAGQAFAQPDAVTDWLNTPLPVFTPDFQKVLLVDHRWRGR